MVVMDGKQNDFPDIATPGRYQRAITDLIEGWCHHWLWTRLSVHDIRMRYRGSMLGPLWLTISTAFMAFVMGVLYSRLFKADVATYLPFVTTGLITWNLISGIVNESCQTFVSVADIIQQTKLPYSTHVYRMVTRNILVFLHNVVILPVLYLFYPPHMSWHLLEIVPGLIVLCVNGAWISCALGMLGARFRDLQPIISNFTQALFFVTPVFWSPDLLGRWEHLARLNPLFAAVDILRSPLLGQGPGDASWPVMLGLTVCGLAFTMLLFARFRSRIAYWV